MTGWLKFFLRGVTYLFLAGFLVLFVLVGVLAGFEQRVPEGMLHRLMSALSGTNALVTAESAFVHLARGRVRIDNLRVFDRSRAGAPAGPMLSAGRIDLGLDLFRLPWSANRLLREVVATRLRYPRLPEGYYIPDSKEFPGQPDFQERNEPVRLDLPDLQPFSVKLVQPEILGVTPKDVFLPSVIVSKNGIKADTLHLRWRDQDTPMTLDGAFALDLAAQTVRGEVRGLARQNGIRPMLVALDITNSYQFVDAFTEVGPPVEAVCRYDVDLRTCDLHIDLDLHPPSCRHHGVAVKDVQGPLDIRVFVRDTYQNARIVVGPLRVELADGTKMHGSVVYENTNDVGFVDFDTRFATSIPNALAIADCMNDGTLDCLKVETTPEISLKGRLAVDPAHAAELNDLSGQIAFARGSLFSVTLRDAYADFRVKGTDVVFTNAVALPPHGGRVTGGARISVPSGRRADARFDLDVKGDSIPLKDLAEMFGLDPGERHGLFDGVVNLSGPLETNAVARLTARGRIACREGQLAQMKIFAGLTDILSQNVPLLAEYAPVAVGLVKQSRASADFSLTNGVLRTENLLLEGGTLSIRAHGGYDLVKDDLDFRARVTFTRNDGILATLATPITWPFANLTQRIFEFRLKGPLDNPSWSFNKNPIDRFK